MYIIQRTRFLSLNYVGCLKQGSGPDIVKKPPSIPASSSLRFLILRLVASALWRSRIRLSLGSTLVWISDHSIWRHKAHQVVSSPWCPRRRWWGRPGSTPRGCCSGSQSHSAGLHHCPGIVTLYCINRSQTDCRWFAVLLEYILMMTISGETISTVSINLASQETYLAANNFNCDFTWAPR